MTKARTGHIIYQVSTARKQNYQLSGDKSCTMQSCFMCKVFLCFNQDWPMGAHHPWHSTQRHQMLIQTLVIVLRYIYGPFLYIKIQIRTNLWTNKNLKKRKKIRIHKLVEEKPVFLFFSYFKYLPDQGLVVLAWPPHLGTNSVQRLTKIDR